MFSGCSNKSDVGGEIDARDTDSALITEIPTEDKSSSKPNEDEITTESEIVTDAATINSTSNTTKNEEVTTEALKNISSEKQETAKPVETKKPLETTKAPVTTKAAETNKPATTTKVVEIKKPTETTKPVEDKKYSTAWGTRLYEFEEVTRILFPYDEIGVYIHIDRYGNVWWGHTDKKESGRGKYIYSASYFDVNEPIYLGQGRWSNMCHYWSEDGEYGASPTGICEDGWRHGSYYYPGSWGKNYTIIESDCPHDGDIIEYMTIMNAWRKDEYPETGRQAIKEIYPFLTEADLDAFTKDPTNIVLPAWGKKAP